MSIMNAIRKHISGASNDPEENREQAKKLEKLKEERLRLEGKAKLAKYQANEEKRISDAKATLKSNSTVGKFLKGLKETRAQLGKLKTKKVKKAYNRESISKSPFDSMGKNPFQ